MKIEEEQKSMLQSLSKKYQELKIYSKLFQKIKTLIYSRKLKLK